MFNRKVIKNVSVAYEKRRFVMVFARSKHLVSFLIQMNPFHIRPLYFLKTSSNTILSSTTSLLYISKQNPACIFIHSCKLHALFFSLSLVLCLNRGILHSLNSEYYPRSSFFKHVELHSFLNISEKASHSRKKRGIFIILLVPINCVLGSRMYNNIFNPYPTAFPYGNGMVLHFYQQQESSTTKTVHKVINKGLKTYV